MFNILTLGESVIGARKTVVLELVIAALAVGVKNCIFIFWFLVKAFLYSFLIF